jgi:2-succinyl-5-enolpyruvyl-6-hydroxy-3-cyclohexene-1-carboxylate synthase
MTLGDVSLRCATFLVDELARGGVRHACLSPGSRSTPLALALARHPAIELRVQLDERSGGFVALGIARATARPVVAACTSGTAAAEFLPAVVEASRSRVPLVLLTADRPPRLRGTGANQTIDQTDLFGRYADFLEPPVPSVDDDAHSWAAVGHDAVAAMRRSWQPVQVNCPFDTPLTPSPGAGTMRELASEPPAWSPPPSEPLAADDSDRLADEVSGARGVVVIGGTWPYRIGSDAVRLFERLGWPVLAEPISNLRVPGTLAAGQALIGDDAWTAAHRPDLVLQLGATPTTRVTDGFVGSAERLIVADRIHPDPDPDHRATWRLRADLPAVIDTLRARGVAQRTRDGSLGVAVAGRRDTASTTELERATRLALAPSPHGWLAAWRRADARARRAIDGVMDSSDEPLEPRIARDVAAAISPGGILFVGSSTPVRDLDLAMAPRDDLTVVGNRGASGIDGSIATAFGVATGSTDPTTALLGDLSTLYDLGTLAWNAHDTAVDLTLVVVNNGGGHIFSLLPQRELPEHRALFVTPQDVDLAAVCAALRIEHRSVQRASELPVALHATSDRGGIRVVDVEVPTRNARARRDDLAAAVSRELAGG